MTNFDEIKAIYDIDEMSDYLCHMTGSVCEHCKFADGRSVKASEECALTEYLRREVDE